MSEEKFKILCVDDEPDVLNVLSKRLSAVGYTVIMANNGKKAIEMAKAERPDLILLDVLMPIHMVRRALPDALKCVELVLDRDAYLTGIPTLTQGSPYHPAQALAKARFLGERTGPVQMHAHIDSPL